MTRTFMPGFALPKFATGEIGSSVALSRVGYLATDLFEARSQPQHRLQPNAFLTPVKANGVEIEGSLSPYFCRYDTTDFDDVKQLLYTRQGQVSNGFMDVRRRFVADHPGHHAVVCIARHRAVARGLGQLQVRRQELVSLLTRYRRDDYLNTDLWSTTFLTGFDFAHDFGDGYIGTAGASVRQVRRPDEVQPWALNVQIGFQKKLDFGDAPKAADAKVTEVKPRRPDDSDLTIRT